MNTSYQTYDTIVVGGGQAGLTTGYYLKQHSQDFAIFEASNRVGDVWRKRWDSLHLFTPAPFDGLAGMPFPAGKKDFPTKDAMGDFLESYANHFELPVHLNTRVDCLTKQNGHFELTAGDKRYEAQNVIVAMGNFQKPNIPDFASDLDPGIVQFHSKEYRNPSQLQQGDVLIVGAGNSGSEIGMELAKHTNVWMSGRSTGHLPLRIDSPLAHLIMIKLVLRGLFHRVLSINSPIGRKARPAILSHGSPLIRVKPKDMAEAGIKRVPRTAGVQNGLPVLEDGRTLDVPNVIWCTGYETGFDDWIEFPIFGEHEPKHERGIVQSVPGLYFVGLNFQYSLSSEMIHGVRRDAEYIVEQIVNSST